MSQVENHVSRASRGSHKNRSRSPSNRSHHTNHTHHTSRSRDRKDNTDNRYRREYRDKRRDQSISPEDHDPESSESRSKSRSKSHSRTATAHSHTSRSRSRSSTWGASAPMTFKKSQIKQPLTYNAIQSAADPDCIVLTKNGDGYPIKGKSYFSHPMPIGLDAKQELNLKCGINVFIPIFDQHSKELEKTLTSLYVNYKSLCEKDPYWKEKPLHVCLIQDGWKHAHASMQSYLKKLFPKIYVINNSDSGNHGGNHESGMARLRTISMSTSGGRRHLDSRNGVSQPPIPSHVPSQSRSHSAYKHTRNPTQSQQYWWDFHKEFSKNSADSNSGKKDMTCTTFVFEKSFENATYFSSEFNEMVGGGKKRNKRIEHQLNLNITLVIKIDHRGKFNSQEWFMGKEGFCDVYRSKYIFLTEMHTELYQDCLYYLVSHIDFNASCSVAIGDQEYGHDAPFIVNLLRHGSYAFEDSYINAIYNPIFNGSNFFPNVNITSFCSLYRSGDLLQDNVRNFYFTMVSDRKSKRGLIGSNLRGSANKLLGFAACVKTADKRCLSCVKRAKYSYSNENSPFDRYLFERRQSINWLVFSIIWLFLSPSNIFGLGNVSCFSKIKLWIVVIGLFFQLLMLFVSPGITLSLLNWLLLWLAGDENSDSNMEETIGIIMYIVWGLWMASLVVFSRMKIFQIALIVLYIISAVISFFVLWIGISVFIIDSANIRDSIRPGDVSDSTIDGLFALLFISVCLPFSCSFMVDSFVGLCNLLTGFIHYIFACHIQLSFVGVYCIGQCWNCVCNEYHGRDMLAIGDAIIQNKYQSQQGKHTTMSYVILVLIIGLNLLFYYFLEEIDKFQCFVVFMIVASVLTLISFLSLIRKECDSEEHSNGTRDDEDARENLRKKDRARRAVAGATMKSDNGDVLVDVRNDEGDSVYDEDIHGAMKQQQEQELHARQHYQTNQANRGYYGHGQGRGQARSTPNNNNNNNNGNGGRRKIANKLKTFSRSKSGSPENEVNEVNNESSQGTDIINGAVDDDGSVYDEDISFAMENQLRKEKQRTYSGAGGAGGRGYAHSARNGGRHGSRGHGSRGHGLPHRGNGRRLQQSGRDNGDVDYPQQYDAGANYGDALNVGDMIDNDEMPAQLEPIRSGNAMD